MTVVEIEDWLRVHADLHTHVIGDGRFDGRERVVEQAARHLEAALEAGLRVIGVTDHDDVRPGLIAQEYADAQGLPLLVIPGMEVTTNEGHLVVLGLCQPLARWQPMGETIEQARLQGAICLLPHPFFPSLRARTDVDAMERLNYRYGDWEIERDDIAIVASSDAHSPADLLANPHHTLLQMHELSWLGFVDALRQRPVEVVRHSRVAQHTI